jgi:hypothetical protein
VQALVEHFEAKDQFLRLSLKRLIETQLFEDELKKVSQLNVVLVAHNKELEARLAEESQAKTGKYLSNLSLYHMVMLEQSSKLTVALFT